jgi:hypothetical protein
MKIYCIMFSIILSLFGSVAYSEDKEKLLIQYIEQQTPHYLKVFKASLRYKDFSSENGGRFSVAGELVVMENLITPTKTTRSSQPENLLRAVMDKGYSAQDLIGVAKEVGLYSSGSVLQEHLEHVVATPMGTTLPFEAELPYIDTVSGLKLSGRLSYPKPQGRIQSEIPRSYVVGSTEFDVLVENVVTVIQKSQVISTSKISVAEKFFAQELNLFFYHRDLEQSSSFFTLTVDHEKSVSSLADWSEDRRKVLGGFTPVYSKEFTGLLRGLCGLAVPGSGRDHTRCCVVG